MDYWRDDQRVGWIQMSKRTAESLENINADNIAVGR